MNLRGNSKHFQDWLRGVYTEVGSFQRLISSTLDRLSKHFREENVCLSEMGVQRRQRFFKSRVINSLGSAFREASKILVSMC
jgi:hypothetical protein